MVLQKNLFVETLLPRAILRRLSGDEMPAYRAPFANAGEDRGSNADVATSNYHRRRAARSSPSGH